MGFRVKGSGQKVGLSAVSFERTSDVSYQMLGEVFDPLPAMEYLDEKEEV
jgi:hypothetical protein